MSSKTPWKRLQRLAEDELGIRPKLQTCCNIMRAAGPKPEPLSTEEWITTVFVTNLERIKASAKGRTAPTGSPTRGE